MSPSEESRWFAEQVLPHEPALRAYLRVRFPSLEDQDDLLQDTYTRLLQALRRGPIGSPRGLLFATARNAALDVFRRRSTARTRPITENEHSHVFDETPHVAELMSREHEIVLLTAAIASLPPRCREVLVLKKFKNHSQREIARMLGISEHTVEVQLTKALHRCRDFFSEHGFADPK